MKLKIWVAAIAAVLTIGFAAASTVVHAADSCTGPLSVSLPQSSADDGDLFCTPPSGVSMLGFSCYDPYYTGPSTQQGLTFVMPAVAYKLPKKLRTNPPDALPGGCNCGGATCCPCGH